MLKFKIYPKFCPIKQAWRIYLNLVPALLLSFIFCNIKALNYDDNNTQMQCKRPEFYQKWILEINPALLANQGLGINTEYFANNFSVGWNLEYYYQENYNKFAIKSQRKLINLAPFMRYYFYSKNPYGPFVGTKLNLIFSKAIISDNEVTANYNNYYVAPSIHFGYRFIISSNFTVSAYTGVGLKTSSNRFSESRIPNSKKSNQNWQNALGKLNENVNYLQPDYGITIGFLL